MNHPVDGEPLQIKNQTIEWTFSGWLINSVGVIGWLRYDPLVGWSFNNYRYSRTYHSPVSRNMHYGSESKDWSSGRVMNEIVTGGIAYWLAFADRALGWHNYDRLLVLVCEWAESVSDREADDLLEYMYDVFDDHRWNVWPFTLDIGNWSENSRW